MSTVSTHKHAFRLSYSVLVVSLLLCHDSALAESDGQGSVQTSANSTLPTSIFDPVTIEGVSEKQTPWFTETSRKELDALQILNWNDFGKRAEPGIYFNESNQSINVRGLDQNRVLTRIDGIRQTWLSDIARGVRGGLSTLDFNTLSAIDIVRGADSSSAGSGALGGVVDVRTLNPEDLLIKGKPFASLLKAGYGTQDNSWFTNVALAGQMTAHTQILLQAGLQNGHETGNMGTIDAYGLSRTLPNPDSYLQQNYQFKLIQKLEGGHSLALSGAYFDREDNTSNMAASPYIYVPDTSKLTNTTQRESLAIDYAWKAEHSNALFDTIDAKVYSQRVNLGNNLDAMRRVTPVGDYSRNNSLKEMTYGVSTVLTKAIAGDVTQHWTVGGEWYGNTAEQSSKGQDNCPVKFSAYSPCKFLRTNQSEMPQVKGSQLGIWTENTLGFANNVFTLTPGLRYDEYEQKPHGTEGFQSNAVGGVTMPASRASAVSPKLLGTWSPAKHVNLFAKYAFGFNAPSPTQLYSRYGSPGTYLVSGNPELKPETSNGWEIGTQLGDDALNGSLTYFDNRYQNFIETVNRPGNAVYPYYVQSFENLESVRIYGIEAKASWKFATGWRTFGSLAWAVGENTHTHQSLNSVAPLTAIAGLAYSQQAWGIQAQVTAAAARTDVTYPEKSNSTRYTDFKAPGYGVADLTAYWVPSGVDGLRLQAGIYNVFNQKYWNALNVPTAGSVAIPRAIDFYTSPGRSVQISMTYQY